MSERPAHEILANVFDIVIEEAKANPDFAQKIVDALPEEIVAKAVEKKKPIRRKKSFDAGSYHAVNILRRYDAGVLEGKLSEVKKEDLKKVASYSGLRLTGPAAKKTASKNVIIQGIIEAAKHYIEQRAIAAA